MLPCKYCCDERGSELLEETREQPEYYPTRTELGTLESHELEIARKLGPDSVLIEYGSGRSRKTRALLEVLDSLAAYIPIGISRETLFSSAEQIAREYPKFVVPLSVQTTSTPSIYRRPPPA